MRRRLRKGRVCIPGRTQPRRLLAGMLTLVFTAVGARGAIVPPGTRVLLTWTSLGSGTKYYVQTSTNLSTWTTPTNTATTNATLNYNGDSTRVFRLWASNAPPQSAALSWNPGVSGGGDVAGYNIYYGTASGSYSNRIDAKLATLIVISNLSVGTTYYFVTTAYTAAGMESGYSNEAVWVCPLNLKITRLP